MQMFSTDCSFAVLMDRITSLSDNEQLFIQL